MKIIVIGASGTIGLAVAAALEPRHEVVRASRRGSPSVDMEDQASIAALLSAAGPPDAVVCCAASARMAPIDAPDEAFLSGLHSKLLGQVALLRLVLPRLRDGGSVTLTAGTFDPPMAGAAFGALVNAGLEAFIRAAALELPRGIRVNAVSPGWVRETLQAMGRDGGTPVADVARAYVEAVEGTVTGQVLVPGTH